MSELGDIVRLVAERSKDLIVVLDEDGVARFASSAARNLLDRGANAVVGHALAEFVHLDDRRRLRRGCLLAWVGTRSPPLRIRVLGSLDSYRWVEVEIELVAGLPALIGCSRALVLTVHDIEAQRSAELVALEASATLRDLDRFLQMAEEMAQVGHLRIDPHKGEIACSAQARQVMGIGIGRMPLRAALRRIHPDDRAGLFAAARAARSFPGARGASFRIFDDGRSIDLRLRCERAARRVIAYHAVLKTSDEGTAPTAAGRPLSLGLPSATALPGENQSPLDILLADDNPVSQTLLASELRRLGHRVVMVEDGRAAVSRAAEQRFDAILMDIAMPELDGVAAARMIRTSSSVNAASPIIGLATEACSERRRFLASAGMTDVLTKPVRADRLALKLAGIAALKARAPRRLQSFDEIPHLDLLALCRLGGEPSGALADELRGSTVFGTSAIRSALARREYAVLREEVRRLEAAYLVLGAPRAAAAAAGLHCCTEEDELRAGLTWLGEIVGDTLAQLEKPRDPHALAPAA